MTLPVTCPTLGIGQGSFFRAFAGWRTSSSSSDFEAWTSIQDKSRDLRSSLPRGKMKRNRFQRSVDSSLHWLIFRSIPLLQKKKRIRLLTSPKPSVSFEFLLPYVSTLQMYLSCNLCDSSQILAINIIITFLSPFVLKPFFNLFSFGYLVNFIINFIIVASSNCLMLILWMLAAYSAVIYRESSIWKNLSP